MDNVDRIIAYEASKLSDEEAAVMFQALIDFYSRMAAALVEAGLYHQATWED